MQKPGKMVFTAGRKDIDDLFKKKRSKPRKPKANPTAKPQEKKEKSVYDLSLEESLIDQQTRKFAERISNVAKRAPGEDQSVDPASSAAGFAERMNNVGKGAPSGYAQSPHGIMLVLGTGKRTKPRLDSKNVQISHDPTSEVHPPPVFDEVSFVRLLLFPLLFHHLFFCSRLCLLMTPHQKCLLKTPSPHLRKRSRSHVSRHRKKLRSLWTRVYSHQSYQLKLMVIKLIIQDFITFVCVCLRC
jgi:hypothetical protein